MQTPLEEEDEDFDLADLINVQEMKLQTLDTPSAVTNYRRALKGFPAIQETDESDQAQGARRGSASRRTINLKQNQPEQENNSVHIPDGKKEILQDDSKLEELKASLSIIHSQFGQDQQRTSQDQKDIEDIIKNSITTQPQNSEMMSDRKTGNGEEVNEIIVKIELKKFQNLIQNKLNRKNNLIHQDPKRIFPLNKIADGSAFPVQLPKRERRIKSTYKVTKNQNTEVLKSKECLSFREHNKQQNTTQQQFFDFSDGQSRPRTRQKSEIPGRGANFLPVDHWFNRNFEEPVILQQQISLDTPSNYAFRNQSQNQRQKTAAPGSRQKINSIHMRHHRVNQSANFSNSDIFQNAQVYQQNVTQQFQGQIQPFQNYQGPTRQGEQTSIPTFSQQSSKPGTAVTLFKHRRLSSQEPDLRNSKNFLKQLEQKIQPQTITNQKERSSKRQIFKDRLEQLKQNPNFDILYRRYQEQKPKFKTQLAKILNEEFDELEAKSELYKNQKKVQKLLGEISQKPAYNKVFDQNAYDPDYIERMRKQKRSMGSKLQKLCYAVPTFKEKLLESLKLKEQ